MVFPARGNAFALPFTRSCSCGSILALWVRRLWGSLAMCELSVLANSARRRGAELTRRQGLSFGSCCTLVNPFTQTVGPLCKNLGQKGVSMPAGTRKMQLTGCTVESTLNSGRCIAIGRWADESQHRWQAAEQKEAMAAGRLQ